MGFIKIGSRLRITKVGSSLGDLELGQEQGSRVQARLVVADFVRLNPQRFIYTRERAVSAYERYGLNGNADGFVDEELKRRYATFINVPRYVDHVNTDPSRAVGIVLDAVYHPLTHPKGGWVETVSALDRQKMASVIVHSLPDQPNLLDAVLGGKITDVSMGCLKAGTPVLLANGCSIPIEQIQKGDRVISHTGSARGVTEINVRRHQGVCYELKVYGVRTPFTITGEHPLLLVRREETACHPSPSKGNGFRQHVCVQGSQGLKKQCVHCETTPEYHFDWVPVEDSSVGDYLAMPVPNFEVQESFTDDEARILGYYLAEGCLLKNRLVDGTESVTGISFSTGLNESGTHQLLCELGARVGASVSEMDYPERSGKYISFWGCAELARKCRDHCGKGAKEKNLSVSVLGMSPEQILLFLGAYANGDGGAYKGSLYFSTSSSQLADQIRILLLRIGMIASVNQIIHKPSALVPHETTEYQVWIGTDTSWRLQTPDTARLPLRRSEKLNSKRFFYEHGGTVYLMAPIESIEEILYDDLVYNFEVDRDHSYLVHGLAVHNCYVESSVCTVCGNRAATEVEYCDHVVAHRGKRIKAASSCPVVPDKEGFVVAGELNFGASFFELSTILSLSQMGGGGADIEAKILEKIAGMCSGWECYLVDRLPKRLELRPSMGANEGCNRRDGIPRSIIRPNLEEAMEKIGAELAPVAPDGNQSVTDRITPAVDPGDEDKGLHEQSKGKSGPTTETSVGAPDNVGQEGKAKDYPLAARHTGASEADPANRIGGEPPQVAEEKEKERKNSFEQVKPELGDHADEVEEKMRHEIDQEKPLSEALASIFIRRFPTIANSERFKEVQDELDVLETRRSSLLSAMKRTRSARRKDTLKLELQRVNAGIAKYFAQFAGNPQDMDETYKGDYEQGDPDKNLAEQAKGKSGTGKPFSVAQPENVAAESAAETKDYANKTGKKVIASSEADRAAEEMLNLVWHQGKSFEEAQQIVFDRYGRDVAVVSAEKAEEPPEQLEKMKEKAESNEKDKEGAKTAEGEPVEVDKASKPSDISQTVGDDEQEMEEGNETTLVSPETRKIAPSTELIQARLSRDRSALYRHVMGADPNGKAMSGGTDKPLASPETKGVAETEDEVQKKKLEQETKGVSVPAQITGQLGLALAGLSRAQKEITALKAQNTAMYKKLEAVKSAWKWEEVKKIAVVMLKKGFFLEAPDGTQRAWPQQKVEMVAEARRMMKMPNQEIERMKSLIARAPVPGTPVRQWTRKIAMPRSGTVQAPVVQRGAISADEISLDKIFE